MLTELYSLLGTLAAIEPHLAPQFPPPETGIHLSTVFNADAARAAWFNEEAVEVLSALPYLNVGDHEMHTALQPNTYPISYLGSHLNEDDFLSRREMLEEDLMPLSAIQLTWEEGGCGLVYIYDTEASTVQNNKSAKEQKYTNNDNTELVTPWKHWGDPIDNSDYFHVPSITPRQASLNYKEYVTTRDNIANRCISMAEDTLPSIFQNAIQVVRKLGIRYLWIDALCIIQNVNEPLEDQVDWKRESAKMADIFSGTLITICAASAVGSEGGLFNESSHTAFQNPDIDYMCDQKSSVRFVHENGKISTLHFLEDDRTLWHNRKSLHGNCLNGRAWCYQEDLLSPRKLYYCKDQLYWHCDHAIASEDRLVNRAQAPLEHARFALLQSIVTASGWYTTSEYWYNRILVQWSAIRAL